MEAQTVVVLASLVIAVSVPWVTFRLALRQDQIRRIHEQRSQLYVDLLTEAYAEQQYFEFETADDETRDRMRVYFHDLRLPPMERARLGARGTGFASAEVNRLFKRLQGLALEAILTGARRNEANRLVARMKVGEALEELQQAVRRELGDPGGKRSK
jgi:hypothetical protein